MTIPCVTVADTRPTFYLVQVATALSHAVFAGQYPTTQTPVWRRPTVATGAAGTGMGDTEYRWLALKRFLAFKTLGESHWERVSEGV